jgi:hypothetical protein
MNKATVFLFVILVSFAGNAAVTITGVGDGSDYDIIGNEAASYYTTRVTKTYDVDGDNQYGTSGYLIFGGSSENNGGEYGTAGSYVESVPSFVDLFSTDASVTLIRNNSSQVAMDDPSATVNGTDFVYSGYLMNNASVGTTDLPMVSFSVSGSDAASFRIGVIAGHETNADGRYDPVAVRLSFDNGTTASVTSLSALHTGSEPGIGMVFFDVTVDKGTAGTFTIAASERSNNPTIGGLTFDAIPIKRKLSLVAITSH